MTASAITLSLWQAFGKMETRPAAAWRLMRFKRKSDGKEGWAAVLPDVWGAWRG